MDICVLLLNDAFDLGMASILDTLATANDLATQSGRTRPGFSIRRVGMRRRIRTHQGLTLMVELGERGPTPDLVLVPAIGAKAPAELGAALLRREVADAGALLRKWSAAGALIGAACTGTFVLAESSLLDGQLATTTWWLAPFFRERFPRVELDDSRMLVKSSRYITAGAALAHLDLALWAVRLRSPELAALAARYLILDRRPSQSAYAIPDHLAHSDPIVEHFEKWAQRHLVERFSIAEAARAIGTSQRTLARRIGHVLGKSPLSYVQDLRVEHAIHLLQTSEEGLEEIAARVGYRNGMTLRTLLRRKTGQSVRGLRTQG
jgi:transcriptional regulator GlxA family with amidase domain